MKIDLDDPPDGVPWTNTPRVELVVRALDQFQRECMTSAPALWNRGSEFVSTPVPGFRFRCSRHKGATATVPPRFLYEDTREHTQEASIVSQLEGRLAALEHKFAKPRIVRIDHKRNQKGDLVGSVGVVRYEDEVTGT